MTMVQNGYRIHILTHACCDALVSCVQNYTELEIHFISPHQLTHALGPVYWQEQVKVLKDQLPFKNIYCWMTYKNAPGLAVGGLRLGAQHIIYDGKDKHFQKIKSLANFYQARVISSYQEI